MYVWADGIHFRVRLEQARMCCLVIVGVREQGPARDLGVGLTAAGRAVTIARAVDLPAANDGRPGVEIPDGEGLNAAYLVHRHADRVPMDQRLPGDA